MIVDALPQERIYFGTSVRDALGQEVERTGAKRVFVAASKTLRRETSAISLLVSTLGAKCVGIFDTISEHSGLDSVSAATIAARKRLMAGITSRAVDLRPCRNSCASRFKHPLPLGSRIPPS